MKKNLLVLLLSSVLLLGGCNTKNNNQSGSGDQSGKQSESETGNKKIKEIALKGSAPDQIYVTEKVATTALFEIRANKGQTLKTADKKVTVTSSNPSILSVENTGAVITTFLTALNAGTVTITVQSAIQEDAKLDINFTVLPTTFDRQANCLQDVSWENVDLEHEADEVNPYVKTSADEGVNHQFFFRDSYSDRCYMESEITFYSEKDGNAHLPKLGFIFSTNEINDTNIKSVSFIYLNTDCRGGNDTYYYLQYNEIASGVWGWDYPEGTPLAKSYAFYKYEPGVKKAESFKLGVVKEGYNYHVYFNDVYVKSIKTTDVGFSTDKTYSQAAPTICGMFDFKSEVKYANYSFTTTESVVASKIPAEPDFTNWKGE